MTSTTTTAARLPLTSLEQEILKDLIERLTKTESQFCCGGVIQLPVDRKLSLLYKLGVQDEARSLELPPKKSDAVKQLLDACRPSAHGRGKETVFDESYRLARELQQDNFALTMDILNESGVLASIAALTAPRNPSDGLVARLYKLNAYAAGGFFKAHRDTPKSDRHIGTLVVALPIPFEGGALRVSHEGKLVLFEWDANIPGISEQVTLPWAFLFSDVEHEVLPVTSGTRVTLAYDIFASEGTHLSVPPAIDGTTLPIYNDLKAALNNQDFLPRGGKIAVALSHAYPLNSYRASDAFASRLKGSDAALHRVLSTLGVPIELRAVYSSDDEETYQMIKDGIPDDEFGPTFLVQGHYWPLRILYTSNTFKFYEGHDNYVEDETALFKSKYGGSVEPNLIWARKPSNDVSLNSGYYIRYGDEASLGTLYIAAAFVLDIPAAGQLSRASI